MPDDTLRADVLVVGAGPTGLMLANWLARAGVDFLLVDAKGHPTVESRAVVLQARTMEILDQLGMADAVARAARDVQRVAPGFHRTTFGVMPVGELGEGVSPYPRLTVLEQSKTERLLYDRLRRRGGDVLWNTRVDDVAIVDGHAAVDLVGPGGRRSVLARYCVGTDGSNSAVRRGAGIPFEGTTNEQIFWVCDAYDVRGIEQDAVNVRLGDRDFLLTFPMGRDHHRLIGLLPAEPGDDIVEEDARRRALETTGVRWRRSAWFSTYRVHHRVARTFRSGPFLLAGDAAHVHSPVGAQGMNTGLQDAHNLAFKLADVLRGEASDSSLDRYDAERRPVALRLVSTADRVFALAIDPGIRERTVRRLVAPLLLPVLLRIVPRLPVGKRMFGYLSQTRIHYWMSDAQKEASGGRRDPVVGRRLRFAGDNFTVLRDAVWQVHSYGDIDPADARRLRGELGVAVHTFPRAPRSVLRARTFYLVRPDGFVAAKAAPADAVPVFRPLVPRATADVRGVC